MASESPGLLAEEEKRGHLPWRTQWLIVVPCVYERVLACGYEGGRKTQWWHTPPLGTGVICSMSITVLDCCSVPKMNDEYERQRSRWGKRKQGMKKGKGGHVEETVWSVFAVSLVIRVSINLTIRTQRESWETKRSREQGEGWMRWDEMRGDEKNGTSKMRCGGWGFPLRTKRADSDL